MVEKDSFVPKLSVGVSAKLEANGSRTSALIRVIEKIADRLLDPAQIRDRGKARVEVQTLQDKADADGVRLKHRTARRVLSQELDQQSNLERTIQIARAEFDGDTTPASEPSADWLAAFRNGCQDVSDTDMQQLWARVLRGELNSPGSMSKHTLSILTTLDSRIASVFVKLIRFRWTIGGTVLIVLQHASTNDLKHFDLRYPDLLLLTEIGLTSPSMGGLYRYSFNAGHYLAQCQGGSYYADCHQDIDIGLPVVLTSAGQEIARIADVAGENNALVHSLQLLADHGFMVSCPHDSVARR